MSLGGQTYQGTFDEDIGSTMLFDRGSLKRLADAHMHETRDLALAPTDGEEPLVCITTKRLRLTTLMSSAEWTTRSDTAAVTGHALSDDISGGVQ